MSGNMKVIENLLAEFGRGDTQAVLDLFAENVDWRMAEGNASQSLYAAGEEDSSRGCATAAAAPMK